MKACEEIFPAQIYSRSRLSAKGKSFRFLFARKAAADNSDDSFPT
jgi:hypothetical protein